MNKTKDNLPPEPAFRLRWHDDGARYTVSKPNIGDTDVYTADQVAAAFERGKAAMQGEIERLKEEDKRLYLQTLELRAKLKALKEQKPVAYTQTSWLKETSGGHFWKKKMHGMDVPLYLAAGAKP